MPGCAHGDYTRLQASQPAAQIHPPPAYPNAFHWLACPFFLRLVASASPATAAGVTGGRTGSPSRLGNGSPLQGEGFVGVGEGWEEGRSAAHTRSSFSTPCVAG